MTSSRVAGVGAAGAFFDIKQSVVGPFPVRTDVEGVAAPAKAWSVSSQVSS